MYEIPPNDSTRGPCSTNWPGYLYNPIDKNYPAWTGLSTDRLKLSLEEGLQERLERLPRHPLQVLRVGQHVDHRGVLDIRRLVDRHDVPQPQTKVLAGHLNKKRKTIISSKV